MNLRLKVFFVNRLLLIYILLDFGVYDLLFDFLFLSYYPLRNFIIFYLPSFIFKVLQRLIRSQSVWVPFIYHLFTCFKTIMSGVIIVKYFMQIFIMFRSWQFNERIMHVEIWSPFVELTFLIFKIFIIYLHINLSTECSSRRCQP